MLVDDKMAEEYLINKNNYSLSTYYVLGTGLGAGYRVDKKTDHKLLIVQRGRQR